MYQEQVKGFEDVGLDAGDEGDEAVEASSGACRDEDPAQEHHKIADAGHDQIAHAVAEDGLEPIVSSHTEVLAS